MSQVPIAYTLLAGLFATTACVFAGEEPNLNDPAALEKILDQAVPGKQLNRRIELGEDLLYEIGKEDPFTGWTKIRYVSNGQLRQVAHFREGKPDGLSVEWYGSGQKWQQSLWIDGKLEGPGTIWHENGQKACQGNYKDGEKDGLWTKWDDEGGILSQDRFSNGMLEGNSPKENAIAKLARDGAALGELGRFAEAEVKEREAVKRDPMNGFLHYNLGSTLLMQCKLAEAEEAFRTAIALEPEHLMSHTDLGTALGMQGKSEESEKACRRGVELIPAWEKRHGENRKEFAQAYDALGNALYDQRHFAQAEKQFEEAVALDPMNANAQCNLGAARSEQGKYNEAVEPLRTAVKLDPEHAKARANLAELLRRMGKSD